MPDGTADRAAERVRPVRLTTAWATAGELLKRSEEVYDQPGSDLPRLAREFGGGAFAGGARWMAAALSSLRGAAVAVPDDVCFQTLGMVKYGVATASALAVLAAAWAVRTPVLALLMLPAFYAVEVQMVFLFPVALDKSRRPFRDGRAMTGRAGGTVPAMLVVLRIAALMLFGGFFRLGFVRSWCVGCLAVCLWYEIVRTPRNECPSKGSAWPLELFGSGELRVRTETVGITRSAGSDCRQSILFASDLHLGRPWTRRVATEVILATAAAMPDVIVLGGDLVDCRRGLRALAETVRKLAAIAPVYAISGNHDHRVGMDAVRAAVSEGAGRWLDQTGPVRMPGDVWLHADTNVPPARDGAAHVLCLHDPAAFSSPLVAAFDVTLAGHLHGGQFVSHRRGLRLYPGFLVNRWTGLRFERSDRHGTLIVSRGAGDTLPLRWNCPREVVLCRIVS